MQENVTLRERMYLPGFDDDMTPLLKHNKHQFSIKFVKSNDTLIFKR